MQCTNGNTGRTGKINYYFFCFNQVLRADFHRFQSLHKLWKQLCIYSNCLALGIGAYDLCCLLIWQIKVVGLMCHQNWTRTWHTRPDKTMAAHNQEALTHRWVISEWKQVCWWQMRPRCLISQDSWGKTENQWDKMK